MKKKKKIQWEKWNDPLHNVMGDDDEQDDVWQVNSDDDELGGIPYDVATQKFPVLQTPFGFVSMFDHSYMSKTVDFWIMHTNFDITPEIAEIINKIEGVEILEILTRYRARLGFPKSGLFDSATIIQTIENNIIRYEKQITDILSVVLKTEVTNHIVSLYNQLEKKYEYWTLLVLPNGNTEIATSQQENSEYQQRKNILIATKQAVSGCLFTSDGELLEWSA